MTQHDRLKANFEHAKSGQYYTLDSLPAFFAAVGDLEIVCKSSKLKYYNVPCSFDIETTSFSYSGVGVGTMYLWGFCLNGAVMIGRTWQEFRTFINYLTYKYSITPALRLPVYVRLLGFEFQFIRKHFEWHDVFARQLRAPMRAATTGGLEFRDSYVLTGQKLEKTAEELIELKVQKLVGNVDYALYRHSGTPLTAAEIQYQINDVLVDCSLINDKIRQDGNVAQIPMTSTGYTRRFVRRKCLPANSASRWWYVKQMQQQRLTVDEYVIGKASFAGGYVHASPQHACTLLFDLYSEDWTSAYPAAMCEYAEYPISKGFEIDPTTLKSRQQLFDYADKFAFFGVFELEDVDSNFEYDYYLSESKVVELSDDAEVFNGRIASASHFKTALSHIDFKTLMYCYSVGAIRVLRLFIYRKSYLPKPYIEAVLDRYNNKTKLKNVAGREEDYMAAKRDTNSLYGMLVTMIDRPEVVYKNNEWSLDHSKLLPELIADYNDKETRFINFLWGVIVTAITRHNLMHTICDELKDDYAYSDTDSAKFKNYEKHKAYFENWNKGVDARIAAVCSALGIDEEKFRPKTIKGEEKVLGYWDFDGHYTRFKALRAKAYMYTTQADADAPEELHITMSGVSKQKAVEFLLYKYKNDLDAIFDAFDENLLITGEQFDEDGNRHGGTGKLTHLYNDVEFTAELTDYLGNTQTVHEMSSVNLSPCDFEVGFPEAFKKFLRELRKGVFEVPEIIYN